MIYLNEYRTSKFNGHGSIVPWVHSRRAAADIIVAFEDGDVGGNVSLGGILGKVVGSG